MPRIVMPKISLDQETTLRERLFFAAILLCILFVFSSYLWSPQGKKIDALKQELSGAKMQMDSMKKLIETTQAQIAKQASEPSLPVKTDDRAQRILERRVTDTTKEINMVVDILGGRNFAKQLQINNITTGKTTEEKNYLVVPINVELEGRYGALQSYLQAIEKLELPIIIKSFRLVSEKDSQGMLDARIDINLFIVKR